MSRAPDACWAGPPPGPEVLRALLSSAITRRERPYGTALADRWTARATVSANSSPAEPRDRSTRRTDHHRPRAMLRHWLATIARNHGRISVPGRRLFSLRHARTVASWTASSAA